MAVCGLGIVGMGIYIYVEEQQADFFDLGFICTGLVLALMSLFGLKLKTAPSWLACYLFIMVLIATFMLFVSIAFFVKKSDMVELAAQEYAKKMDITEAEAQDELSGAMTIVGLFFLSFTGVVWCLFTTGFCYRKST